MDTKQLLNLVNKSLDDSKAIECVSIDVRKLTTITDYMVICSGRSTRHVSSIANNLVKLLKENNSPPLSVEGTNAGEWALVDCNDVLVHIMLPDTRKYYDIEKLWSEDILQTSSS